MIIKVKGYAPECPLCYKKMREVITPKGIFYVCLEEMCMVSINSKDPLCGRWRDKEATAAPACPLCKEKMRMFFNSSGFLILQCRNTIHNPLQIARGKAEYLPPEAKK